MNVPPENDAIKGVPEEQFLAVMREHGLMTRGAIARELGVSRQTVERWCRGERSPQGRMIARMQKRFGTKDVIRMFGP